MQANNKQILFLDGFRAYAILFVILGHINSTYMFIAEFGVTLFFFVSGFLITKLLIVEYNKTHTINLKNFYIRRFIRLYPALIYMLIMVCIIAVTYGYRVVYQEIFAGFFYYFNYYRVYFQSPVPAANYPTPRLLWSLAVEEHFYLIFPLLFLLFYTPKNNRFAYLLACLLVFFLSFRFYTLITSTHSNMRLNMRKTYLLSHYRADSILYGCLSAIMIYKANCSAYLKLLRSKYCLALGILFLAIIQVVPWLVFKNSFRFSLQGIALAFIIPSQLFMNSNSFSLKLLENKIIVFLGRLSYSLYLFHWVAIAILDLYYPQRNLIWFLLFFSMSILLSLSSYYGVERSFLKLRKRFGSNTV